MRSDLTFKEYLEQMGHTPKTIDSYCYTVDIYLNVNPDAEGFQYRDVLAYMTDHVKNYKGTDTKHRILASIKKYYDYLVETGRREDHPCRTLYLKGRRSRDIIHHDLFTSQELELLMEREERYPELKLKNQAVLSLLIYQGLAAGEILNMKVHHVDLDRGTIYVRESRTLSRRHLEIQTRQYRILDQYLGESRQQLLRCDTDQLIIGKLGQPITVDDVNYLVSTFKPLFPDRNLNPKTVRQSVIANWLNEKRLPLEQVQLMAGHKWISTTDRYRFAPVEEQRELINRFHPLGQKGGANCNDQSIS